MQKCLLAVCRFCVFLFLILNLFTNGCAPSSAIRMPEKLPPVVREYKHVSISPWKTDLIDTEIHLVKGDFFSILVDAYYKRYSLTIKVEQEYIYTDYFSTAPISGNLIDRNSLWGGLNLRERELCVKGILSQHLGFDWGPFQQGVDGIWGWIWGGGVLNHWARLVRRFWAHRDTPVPSAPYCPSFITTVGKHPRDSRGHDKGDRRSW
jgi:hypothetical protein